MSKKTVTILVVIAALLVLGYFLFYKGKEQANTSAPQTEVTQPADSDQPGDSSAEPSTGDAEGTGTEEPPPSE